ncbi:MAG: hypothetical protein RI897_3891 [Verrucomicrobiota bacterium]
MVAEVIEGGGEALAEEEVPEAVDHDAGGEEGLWAGGVGEPVGEVEAGGSFVLVGDCAEELGDGGLDYFAGFVEPVPAREDTGGAGCAEGLRDHGEAALLSELFQFRGGLGQVFLQLVQLSWGRVEELIGELLTELRQAGFGVRREDHYFRCTFGGEVVGAIAEVAGVVDVGEERGERIEVTERVGVVFMVVALGAADGGAHPDGGEVTDAVGGVDGDVFPGLESAFVGGLEEAVIAGGDFLGGGGIGEEVAGELFTGELVEGHVVIEGVDDPIAVGGDIVVLIAVVADRIGVADEVEPVGGHAFTKGGVFEEGIDEGVVVCGGYDLGEALDLVGGWGEAGEVESESAEESDGVSRWGGLEVVLFEALEDEGIDPVGWVGGFLGGGYGVECGSGIGPMSGPLGTGEDPVFELGYFLCGEGFAGFRWGHQVGGL